MIVLAKSHEIAACNLEDALRDHLQRNTIWLLPLTSKSGPSLKADDRLCIRVVDTTAPSGEWELNSPEFTQIRDSMIRLLPDHYPNTRPENVYISTLDARYKQGAQKIFYTMLQLRYGHRNYLWDYDFSIAIDGIAGTKKTGKTAHYILFDNGSGEESVIVPGDVTHYIASVGQVFWPDLTFRLGAECSEDPDLPANFCPGFTPY